MRTDGGALPPRAANAPVQASAAEAPAGGTRGAGRAEIGARLRRLRQDRGWTLADAAERTGLAVSTLSKVERGLMSLAYDKFGVLAAVLGLDIADLFTERGNTAGPCPRPVITRRGEEQSHTSGPYVYGILSAGMRGRQMMPVRGRILARSLADFPEWQSHPGEEFLHILSGAIELHIEGEAPIPLRAGDSVYFDSGRRHVYLTTSAQDAEILTVMLPQFPAGPAQPDSQEARGAGGLNR